MDLFQFLYGAIKRSNTEFCLIGTKDFNSSMVRLKELNPLLEVQGIVISIPLWCD